MSKALKRRSPQPYAPVRPKLYDVADCETMMCLWEAYLEAETHAYKKHTADNTPLPDEFGLRSVIGSYSLRHAFIALSAPTEKLWKELDEDVMECLTFDFEFCPMVVEHCIDWTLASDGHLSLYKDAKARIEARFVLSERFAKGA